MDRTERATDLKSRILRVLEAKGPSIPIKVAREIQQDNLLTSAFLSELANENKIKISNMKVGGSPIYYLKGQEEQLENFIHYLNAREKQAFLLLKEKKVLLDEEQDPVIRVALRSIKDFAFPFKHNDKVYWRFISVNQEEVLEILNKSRLKIKNIEENIKQKNVEDKSKEQEKTEENDEKKKAEKKEKTEKGQKSNFVKKIIWFLETNNIFLDKEISQKKKEFICLVSIKSDFGKQGFYCVAKDKKNVNENDLRIGLEKAREERSPLLFLSTGKLSKKAKEYKEEWENLIKFWNIS